MRSTYLRTATALLAAISVLGLRTVRANVYPTNLTQSSNTLSSGGSVTLGYLLNENATGVTVSILNSSNAVVRTIAAGAQTTGAQSVMWDGKNDSAVNLPSGNYSFRVNTTGAASAAWTQTSTDGTLNNFELPRGLAVNNNPSSPYYGRVYVSNVQTLPTAAGREMGDGLYMLNADFSDTGIVGGTGPHDGGVDWTTGAASSPFRLQVGQDSNVYITDWSDAHGGLWQAPPDLSGSWTEILDSSGGRDESGLTPVHGSISDVVVLGQGASRVIYTADEDFPVPGSILRYDIGTTTVFTDPPSATFYDNSAGFNINFFNSLAVDKNGNFWYSQNRSAGTDNASLVEIDSTGTIIWDSLAELGAGDPPVDPLRGTQGIAYDPVNNVIALATNIPSSGGNINIFDPDNKTILATFPAPSGTTNTDVAFDNAGNLYVGNRSAEYIRVWSPPSGTGSFVANGFSTDSLAPLGAIALTSGPASNADFDDDLDVDGADLLIWQRFAGGPGSPTTGDADGNGQVNGDDLQLWRTQFGLPVAATPNAGAVPEPGAGVLALIALLAAVGSKAGRRV